MRIQSICLGLAIVLLCPFASAQWIMAFPVRPGPGIETHPAFIQRAGPWVGGGEEQLAFTETSGTVSCICLVRTMNFATAWEDSIEYISGDSSHDDYASYAAVSNKGLTDSTTMVAWERSDDGGKIWYRYFPDTAWQAPARLTGSTASEHRPALAPADSGYFAVWESDGRIAFAQFIHGEWSPPEFVTPDGDPGNANPRIGSAGGYYNRHFPIVAWEHLRTDTALSEVVYSVRSSLGWTPADTIGWTGDNHRPRFSPINGAFGDMMEVSFESNRNGSWDVYTARGYADSTSIRWTDRGVPETPGSANHTDYRDGTLYYWPYITTGAAKISALPEIAGVCVAGSDQSDSIALLGSYPAMTYQNTSAGSISRNPALSHGLFFNSSKVRIMAVWENNSAGGWKLYSSSIDLLIAGVNEEPGLPASAQLYQNYPNPFNSTTRIQFTIVNRQLTIVKVFDVLGREVSTLVNEVKEPGTYGVQFDGSHLASGVYLYRIQAGSFVQSSKLMLLK